ncbi:DUF916 domain-containing protein [Streptomyces sp. NRRL S-87]|uniref:WxL protein peptidoglycan domain-containing protein n=1 Tax=Streptomyces sp. NRRL S-87 TaxID=1463920 RepID=UPI00068AC846|nr:DUF916 domain-containing protein [Streptomyces sp. NRRL S-87]
MRPHRPLVHLLGVLPAVAGALLAVLLGAPAAQAADNGTWAVFPTPAPGQKTTSRAYFFHQGAAGTTLADSVTITNATDAPITFRVYATDAMNTPSGGAFALLPVETRPTGTGTWIRLPERTADRPVTVPAKGRLDIPFTVRIPEDANPGDHVGGIVALNTKVEGIKKDGKVQVGVRRSVGARFYLRVPGPLTPALSIEHLRVDRRAPLLPWTKDARAVVSYSLVNRGNVVLDPRIALHAEGLFGRTVLDRRPKDLGLVLLPGQRVDLTETWADAPQLDRVTLTAKATAAGRPDLAESAGTQFLAVPWPAVGVVLVLTGAGLAAWVVRRRRNRGDEPAEEAPDLEPVA